MRFIQLDNSGTYEWSGTIPNSYNKKTGQIAFTDFDYSSLSIRELRFLLYLMKGHVLSPRRGSGNNQYYDALINATRGMTDRRWFAIDALLNFAPTNLEILKSVTGDASIIRHPLAKEQTDIVKDQLIRNFNIISATPSRMSPFQKASKTDSFRSFFDTLSSETGIPIEYDDSNPSRLIGLDIDNPRSGDLIYKLDVSLNSIDVFEPFLYNFTRSYLTFQNPFYLLWLASEHEKIAERYGISVQFNDPTKLPDIKVDSRYTNLFKYFRSENPDINETLVLPGTEKIQTPFKQSPGLPLPTFREIVFYMRLYHGISAAHDEITTSTNPGFLPYWNIELNRLEDKEIDVSSLGGKFPYRMRYENQFLLPEPYSKLKFDQSTGDFEPKSQNWKVKLERSSIHYLSGKNSRILKDVNPINSFKTGRYKKEDKNFWYFGLWCQPVSDGGQQTGLVNFTGLSRYFPTGFSFNSNYKVFDTETPNMFGIKNPLIKYTSVGAKPEDMNEEFPNENVTVWFISKEDPVINDRTYITRNGTKMTLNGPRGGIPVNYLSLLRVEAEFKGRQLIKEAEDFSVAIKRGIEKNEILPVINSVERNQQVKDVSSLYSTVSEKNKKSIVLESSVLKDVANNKIKITSGPSDRDLNFPVPFISYISNITSVDKNNPDFKYHERPWNKEGTGVHAKIFDPFNPKSWIEFFGFLNPLNKTFKEDEFSSDFHASILDPTIPQTSCSPTDNVMYPRTLIEPQFSPILISDWVDSNSKQKYESLVEREQKIYLQILHAGISSVKHLSAIRSVNNFFADYSSENPTYRGVSPTESELGTEYRSTSVVTNGLINSENSLINQQQISEFSTTTKQDEIITQIAFGTYKQDGKIITSAKDYRNLLQESFSNADRYKQLGDDIISLKSTRTVYWGLNGVTAIGQLVDIALKKSILHYASSIGLSISSVEQITDGVLGTLDNSVLKRLTAAQSASTFFFSTLFKNLSNGYKVLADAIKTYKDPRPIMWVKLSSTITNALISTFAWDIIKNRNIISQLGLTKNVFGWITTSVFLIINELLDSLDLRDKQNRIKEKFLEAYRLGFLEGPYAQTDGNVKIKKTPNGKIPIAYDSQGNPIEYKDQISGIIKTSKDLTVLSYDELFSSKGEMLVWQHMDCIEAKKLLEIIKKDEKQYGLYNSVHAKAYSNNKLDSTSSERPKVIYKQLQGGSEVKLFDLEELKKDPKSAPRVVDLSPTHFDFGVHSRDRSDSFGGYRYAPIPGLLPQYALEDDFMPYINVRLIIETENPYFSVMNRSNNFGRSFVPKFKYSRASYSINKSTKLSTWFDASYAPKNVEFGIDHKKVLTPIGLKTELKKIDSAEWRSGITDSEIVYLIRKKYGLHMVNSNIGNGSCCRMDELIDDVNSGMGSIWPNDGKKEQSWSEYGLLFNIRVEGSESPRDSNGNSIPNTTNYFYTIDLKATSVTREKSGEKEIQRCEYRIPLATQEVIEKLNSIIQKCEEQKKSSANEVRRKTSGCFSSDTEVMTPNGSKKISEIVIGDEVIAFDEAGNLKESYVTNTFHHHSEKYELYRYHLNNGVYVDVTKNHPVLSKNGDFVEIGSLSIGDSLVSHDNVNPTITNIEFLGDHFVYNISVDKYSTYIANGIRVHNKTVAPPVEQTLPISIYNDNVNFYMESLIETNDINELPPSLDCEKYGLCVDVTCPTCNPAPRFIKVCSIPELCLPPKYSNGIPGSLPAWLFDWIVYDFRTEWSGVIRTISSVFSWWSKDKGTSVVPLIPFEYIVKDHLSNPLTPNPREYSRRRKNNQSQNSSPTNPR